MGVFKSKANEKWLKSNRGKSVTQSTNYSDASKILRALIGHLLSIGRHELNLLNEYFAGSKLLPLRYRVGPRRRRSWWLIYKAQISYYIQIKIILSADNVIGEHRKII